MLLLVSSGYCLAASSMGWNVDFESGYVDTNPINGIQGWSAPATVIAQSVVKRETLAAKIPEDVSVTNLFDGTAVDIVWSDMYAMPIIGDGNPTIATNEAVVFYFNASSNPVVYNGTSDAWVTISNRTINPGDWTRISVYQDFHGQKWALFLDGTLAASGIGFASTGTVSAYHSFAIEHNGLTNVSSAYIDDMWVYYTRPDGSTFNANPVLTGDSDSDLMYDAWELDYFQTVARPAGRDYDDDGCTDGKEFADNTNPTNALSFLRNLPYREGIESASVGELAAAGWHGLVPGGTGTVTVQTSSRIEYSKALMLQGTTSSTVNVTLSLTEETATNVWCQMYSKPAFFDTDPTSTNDTAAFYVMTGGTLRALSGSTWTNLMTGIPSNTWIGFAVHLDYISSNWDVYVSTNGMFGASMVKANNGFALSFSTNGPRANFTNVVIETATASYLDAVAVSRAYTNCVTALTNVLASDRLAGQINFIGIPPYNYVTDDDTLDGQLGVDLSREIVENDRIRVFSTNAWNVYSLNSDAWVMSSGLLPGALHLDGSMGLQMDRLGGMSSTVFYPYGALLTNISDRTVYGADDGVAHGWNLLAWPHAPRSVNSGATALGFRSIAGTGDRILIYENFAYRDLYWKTSDNTWKESGSTSGYIMKQGQSFWFYRAANGTSTWPVSGL